ncbi:MAG TPA: M67 family metallopeptidase [Magnetospirillaceae bacterium]|jgi:proteasome lid subunit RPN8/RPN11
MTGGAPRLILSAADRNTLRAGAEAAYPNEYCSLLVGVDEGPASYRVARIVPAANVHPQPRTNFELDPRVLIATLRELRETGRAGQGEGERLLGHAHSHPNGAAQPSAQDAALAHEAGLFWLVMAVRDGTAEDMNAFRAIIGERDSATFEAVSINIR